MPKKHKSIEGVGPSSILELNAQLYKSQEEARRLPKEHLISTDNNYAHHLQAHRAKHKISTHDPFSSTNSGVAVRAAKDKLEMKAVKDGSASYASLEKKAELYEKLMTGEISDEEDNEKYCVDFFRKGVEMEEKRPTQSHDTSNANSQDAVGEEDGSLLPNTKASMLGQTSGSVDRNEHKRLVMEVHEEASQAREKASELKLRQQEQVAARRDKLKQAYLRKKLEKLKASSKIDQP